MKKIVTTFPDPPWDDNVTHNLEIKYIMTTEEITILFAMYLTGHDRKTIEQMFRDWLKHHKND